MKTILSILILILLSAACSPTHRLHRLLALHPELKIPDTLFIKDTIPIPQAEADTILNIDSIHDTIYIHKDRLEMAIHRLHDTLFIRGKCKADTIYINRRFPVEKIKIIRPDKLDNLISAIPWLVSGFIALLALGFFFLRNRR